jgi:hypothetical protein
MAGEEAVSMEQANARIEMSGESITFKGAEVVTE